MGSQYIAGVQGRDERKIQAGAAFRGACQLPGFRSRPGNCHTAVAMAAATASATGSKQTIATLG